VCVSELPLAVILATRLPVQRDVVVLPGVTSQKTHGYRSYPDELGLQSLIGITYLPPVLVVDINSTMWTNYQQI